MKRFSSGEFFRPEFAPETSLRVAKSGEAALGRNAGPGDGDNLSGPPELFEECFGKIHGENDFIEIVSCSKLLIINEALSNSGGAIFR